MAAATVSSSSSLALRNEIARVLACQCYYDVLECDTAASVVSLRSSYKRLARTLHPDKIDNDIDNDDIDDDDDDDDDERSCAPSTTPTPSAPAPLREASASAFAKVSEAWTVLSDVDKRRLYDACVVQARTSNAVARAAEQRRRALLQAMLVRELSASLNAALAPTLNSAFNSMLSSPSTTTTSSSSPSSSSSSATASCFADPFPPVDQSWARDD